jgi:hypothetical protein
MSGARPSYRASGTFSHARTRPDSGAARAGEAIEEQERRHDSHHLASALASRLGQDLLLPSDFLDALIELQLLTGRADLGVSAQELERLPAVGDGRRQGARLERV